LKPLIAGFFVQTVAEAGWSGKKNGALLTLASESFDVLVTADQNLAHQQNLASRPIGFVLLSVGSIKLDDLEPFQAAILDAVTAVAHGEIRRIERVS
jgi:hypothetical protein